MKHKNFLLITLFLSASIFSFGQTRRGLENDIKVQGETAAPRKTILLTNQATFTGNRTLEGASAFLISYKNAVYAVTAKHVLGEAGGIEPEVKTASLARSLVKWQMSPRVSFDAANETVEVNAAGLNYAKSANDILLLNVKTNVSGLQALTPNFSLPAESEQLFIIGCPYSESGCRQNYYPVTYLQYETADATLVCEIKANVEMSGFSGAPLVNRAGEVVGVVIGGGDDNGTSYIAATHIKEIQKIK